MADFVLDDQGIVGPCKLCGQRNRVAYERMSGEATCGKCRKPLPPPDSPMAVEAEFGYLRLLANAGGPVLAAYLKPGDDASDRLLSELRALAAIDAGKILIATVDAVRFPDLVRMYEADPQPMLVLHTGGHEAKLRQGWLPSAEVRKWMVGCLAPSAES
ncbi:MAG: hypothetical protein NT029_19480 [Armatimonadetes bacterium]|nr:hypothetical protein [Armatimonadota bacterium]